MNDNTRRADRLESLTIPKYLPAFAVWYLCRNAALGALQDSERARDMLHRYLFGGHSDIGYVLRNTAAVLLKADNTFDVCCSLCERLSTDAIDPYADELADLDRVLSLIGKVDDSLDEHCDRLYPETPIGAAVALETRNAIDAIRATLNGARNVAMAAANEADKKLAESFAELRASI